MAWPTDADQSYWSSLDHEDEMFFDLRYMEVPAVPVIDQEFDVPVSGLEPIVQTFYEGPERCECCINWVEKQPVQVPESEVEKYQRAAICVYRCKDHEKEASRVGGLVSLRYSRIVVQSRRLIELIRSSLTASGAKLPEQGHVEFSYPFKDLIRKYKEQLKAWGAEKSIPAKVKYSIIQKQQQRLAEGLDTVVFFNGVYLDDAVIQKFRTRQERPSQAVDVSSPTVTPEGVVYLTPLSPDNHPLDQTSTPQAFTPVSKLSAFAVGNYKTLKSHALTLGLLQHDAAVRKVRLITAVKDVTPRQNQVSRKRVGPLDLSVVDGHVHDAVGITATGSGRFERPQSLQHLLWSSQAFANDILRLTRREEVEPESSVTLTLPIVPHAKKAETPRFSLAAQSEPSTHRVIEPMLACLRHNKLLQQILGLSQEDIKSWIGPWERMPDDTAELLHSTAHCLFGNPAAANPHVEPLIILVHFESTAARSKPFLLRIFIGNAASDIAACPRCDQHPMLFDYASGHGSLKLQTPAIPEHRVCGTLEGFLERYRLYPTVFFSRWSSTAYISQGLHYRHGFRICHCNGAVHHHGFKPHVIDLREELNAREERWCPSPAAQTEEEVFQPYPGELRPTSDKTSVLAIEDLESLQSEEDRWDPLGQDTRGVTDEVFESHPSDDEVEQQYASKPVFT